MDYLYAALIFVFIVTVLVVLWKREHPKKNERAGPGSHGADNRFITRRPRRLAPS